MRGILCAGVSLFVLLSAVSLADAGSPLGNWTTYDDDTGEAKSVVEVYQEGETLSARIVTVLNKKEDRPLCTACEDDLKDAPIEGLRFVWDMEPSGDKWKNGRILDPANGKIYKAKMELAENGAVLKVRGSFGPIGRTQEWRRTD